jgi:hypothetical protein
VLAVGATTLGGPPYAVAKLSGETGEIRWTQAMAYLDARTFEVATDRAGNVIALATSYPTGPGDVRGRGVAITVKVDGATGRVLWQQTIAALRGDAEARSLAIDRSGNVALAIVANDATLSGDTYARGFDVVFLSAAKGALVWRKEFPGTVPSKQYLDEARSAVVVDGDGNVVAGGATTSSRGALDFTVVKLSGQNGADLRSFSARRCRLGAGSPGDGFSRRLDPLDACPRVRSAGLGS